MFKALWLDHARAKQSNWGWTPDSRMQTSNELACHIPKLPFELDTQSPSSFSPSASQILRIFLGTLSMHNTSNSGKHCDL